MTARQVARLPKMVVQHRRRQLQSVAAIGDRLDDERLPLLQRCVRGGGRDNDKRADRPVNSFSKPQLCVAAQHRLLKNGVRAKRGLPVKVERAPAATEDSRAVHRDLLGHRVSIQGDHGAMLKGLALCAHREAAVHHKDVVDLQVDVLPGKFELALHDEHVETRGREVQHDALALPYPDSVARPGGAAQPTPGGARAPEVHVRKAGPLRRRRRPDRPEADDRWPIARICGAGGAVGARDAADGSVIPGRGPRRDCALDSAQRHGNIYGSEPIRDPAQGDVDGSATCRATASRGDGFGNRRRCDRQHEQRIGRGARLDLLAADHTKLSNSKDGQAVHGADGI